MDRKKPNINDRILLFEEYLKQDIGLSGIELQAIFDERLLPVSTTDDLTGVKIKTTRLISQILLGNKHKGFKIGRTSSPTQRAGGHKEYDRMILLCMGPKSVIEELEAYYNERYLQNPKCDNQRGGSAGPSVAVGRKHYLYLVLR